MEIHVLAAMPSLGRPGGKLSSLNNIRHPLGWFLSQSKNPQGRGILVEVGRPADLVPLERGRRSDHIVRGNSRQRVASEDELFRQQRRDMAAGDPCPVRADAARLDGDGLDAARLDLLGELSGETAHSPFSGGIGGGAGTAEAR